MEPAELRRRLKADSRLSMICVYLDGMPEVRGMKVLGKGLMSLLLESRAAIAHDQ